MTVAVEQHALWSGMQRKIEARREFFEEHARGGDGAGSGLLLAAQQRRASSFTAERQLGSRNRIFPPLAASGKKPSTSFAAWARAWANSPWEISGRPQHPGRTTSTRASAALENFDGGDADLGIVVIGEGVVEEGYVRG